MERVDGEGTASKAEEYLKAKEIERKGKMHN